MGTIEKIAAVALLLILLYCLAAIFFTPGWGDEINFHYPNSKNISLKQILDANSSYSSAYTPVPYLIGRVIIAVHDSLTALRLFNFIATLLLVYFFYRIASFFSATPLLLTLLLTANPYLLRSAFLYYMFNFGMLFAILGIYFYFVSTSSYKYLFAYICWGLAVLSQQWMLMLFVASWIMEFHEYLGKSMSLVRLLCLSLLKMGVLLPALVLFVFWHGLTHPNFHYHALHPGFEHLNATLANWGLAAILIVLYNYKKVIRINYLPLLFLAPLFYLAVPVHSINPGSHLSNGVAVQMASQIARLTPLSYQSCLLGLALFGLAVLVLILSKQHETLEIYMKFALLGFLAAFVASTNLGASHILISLPFLWLIFYQDFNSSFRLLLFTTLQFYLISWFYIIYVSFYKVYEINL